MSVRTKPISQYYFVFLGVGERSSARVWDGARLELRERLQAIASGSGAAVAQKKRDIWHPPEEMGVPEVHNGRAPRARARLADRLRAPCHLCGEPVAQLPLAPGLPFGLAGLLQPTPHMSLVLAK